MDVRVRRFLISSLATAGILPVPTADYRVLGQETDQASDVNSTDEAVIQEFARDQLFQLAQHRSHSSHSSHRSHRSGAGGSSTPRSYPAPAPAPSPRSSRNTGSTPPSSVLPSSPATAPNRLFQAPAEDPFKETIRRVQRGLIAYGYYSGKPDGIVGPQTRAALMRFQTDYGLTVTGTVNPEVLDAFGISAN